MICREKRPSSNVSLGANDARRNRERIARRQTHLKRERHDQVARVQPVPLLHRSCDRERILPDAHFSEKSGRFGDVRLVDEERVVGCWVQRIEVFGTRASVENVDL